MHTEPYLLKHPETVCSPALLFYEDIIRENTKKVIQIAGGAERLWPHVKSHKAAHLIRMQLEMGIRRFKCATIMELRMLADCAVPHALLAYPLIGPNIELFLEVAQNHPATRFYAIADSREAVASLAERAAARGMVIPLLIDVNMGMNRTGAGLSLTADFVRTLSNLPGVRSEGFHCYDGHIHASDPAERRAEARPALAQIQEMRKELEQEGIPLPIIIAGGSPTFPCHAQEEGVFLSPGTVFLWDWGYRNRYPDLPLRPAALVLARVVSRPADGLFTLDAGNKAIAADPTGARGAILGMENAESVLHSEEHWVFRTQGERPPIGSVQYIIPTHICPTSALYREAVIVSGGEVRGSIPITARDRDSLLP